NLFGYRLVSDYLQQKYDARLEARLDKNHYNEAELVELKIPIHLPYQTSWADFERYDGEVEFNGILYKYVKRKVANDTLIVLCIPNQQKMNLQTAKNDFFKTTNDLANNNSKKSGGSKTIFFKKLTSEYDDRTYNFNANVVHDDQKCFGLAKLVANLLSSPHISPEQPPDFIGA
ncbi:MAG: hypothetical protein ABIO55_09275, partial [Ginsengibacter sp.]